MTPPAEIPLTVLQSVHESYDPERMEDLDALYRGGEAFDKRAGRFLWKRDVEEAVGGNYYSNRLARATYIPRGSVIDFIVGAVHEDEPRVESADPYWAGLNKDADGAGTDLAQFSRQILYDLLIPGRSFPAVDFTQPVGRLDKPDTLRARFVRLPVGEVDDWSATEVRRHTKENPRPALWASPEAEVERWTFIDAENTAVYRKASPADAAVGAVAVLEDLRPHTFGRCPVWQPRFPVPGMHAMDRLRPVLVALFNRESAHQNGLDAGCYPVPVLEVNGAVEKMFSSEIIAIRVRPGEKVYYLQPNPAVYQPAAEDIIRLREEAYRVVQGLALEVAAKVQAPRIGAFAGAMMANPLSVLLRSYAAPLRDTLESMIEAVSRYRGERTPPKLAGFTSFNATLDDMAKAIGQGDSPREKGTAATPEPNPESKGDDA